MCGIVGFIGEYATKKVISGLKSLEYRGYDSAGVALVKDGKPPFIIKSEGRINALELKINGHAEEDFPVAIGHTRWATHGKPSELNAHPHAAGNIALVHNGIIENYIELKTLLREKCARIPISETDTEVIAHLVDVSVGDMLLDKVRRAVARVKGAYALAVVSADEPGTIVVARKKSPLVIGVFDGGAVVASDIHAILPYTNRVYVLQDDELAVVRKNFLCIYRDNGGEAEEVVREPLEIAWSVASVSKDGFKTFMDKEIHEQPIAIYDTMIKNNWDVVFDDVRDLFDSRNIVNVTLTACGTSLHSCMVGAMLFEGNAQIRSSARLASELESSGTILNSSDLVIAISQSGETADTLGAMRYAKKRGANVLAIVNTMGSTIEREADYTIHMAAGPEISVASTKAFVAQLSVLLVLSVIVRGVSWGSFHADHMFENAQLAIYECADLMAKIFEQEDTIKDIASQISKAKSMLYLGRGINFPIALEGALKLKEISYIHAEGFAAGEMKHGPIALIEENTPVVVIATDGPVYNKIMANIEETKARGAYVIAVATEGNEEIKDIADEVIYIPNVSEAFIPLMAVVPLQLLAMYTAEYVGADIDKPRNLAKSVTVE